MCFAHPSFASLTASYNFKQVLAPGAGNFLPFVPGLHPVFHKTAVTADVADYGDSFDKRHFGNANAVGEIAVRVVRYAENALGPAFRTPAGIFHKETLLFLTSVFDTSV